MLLQRNQEKTKIKPFLCSSFFLSMTTDASLSRNKAIMPKPASTTLNLAKVQESGKPFLPWQPLLTMDGGKGP